MSLRKRIFHLVEPSKRGDSTYYFDVLIMVLILLSVIEIILETEPVLKQYEFVFSAFEKFSVVAFTIEYILRLWTCQEVKKFKGIRGYFKFASSPMAIIDLLAILPFYLPVIGIDLRFLRILRLFRVFRILKMARYSNAFDMIRRVFKNKKEELLITLGFIAIILVIVSALMYHLEKDAQPENFSSISNSIWWGIVTLTTVGYGDVYPITGLGRVLGGIITLLGIGLIALPSGIIASGYTEEINKQKEKRRTS